MSEVWTFWINTAHIQWFNSRLARERKVGNFVAEQLQWLDENKGLVAKDNSIF